MIDASFQKKKKFLTIIIDEMDFYFTLLDWRTCTVCSGKASARLPKSSWDELEEIVTYMTGSIIVTNTKDRICIKRHLSIELLCICICETCCKTVEMIVSTVTRRTQLCWMWIDIFRFWSSCGMNLTITWWMIDTLICLGISLGSWCLRLWCQSLLENNMLPAKLQERSPRFILWFSTCSCFWQSLAAPLACCIGFVAHDMNTCYNKLGWNEYPSDWDHDECCD